MEKRSTVGSAIGRNRSRNTRISFRNLEGVCVCVCARSCSPRKYASSRCFGFVARARIIFDAARVSSRLENIRPSLPEARPNFPPPIGRKQFDPTWDRMSSSSSSSKKETKLISFETCSFLIFLLYLSLRWTDDFMRCWILKCRILDRVGRVEGEVWGQDRFSSPRETIRGISYWYIFERDVSSKNCV